MTIGVIELCGIHVDVDGPLWFQEAIAGSLIIALIWSCLWIWRDAEQRGKSGWLAILFILPGWPLSFCWWRWLRPPLQQPQDSFVRETNLT
ncbi:MAG: hypothetical protein K8R23_19140 [Chthoniobacter sp.]|nr:hypothetical protein [Chthoniobacter sp.]